MGKTMNGSDLRKRPFSELTISEQAAVLKARYEEETSGAAGDELEKLMSENQDVLKRLKESE